ncbi:MAG: hydrogenase maturation nickel metallochaperone HypA [Sulfurospirillaceae bacterium]|nr:hydrogenase maturation nickel metallochaperone HypA [Sulfurospirillaceae bacterium]
MHEFSIVNALLELCEKNAEANNASKITKVEIKIGKLSGVEPHLLQTAFDTFKEETICDGAELIVHVQELVVFCNTCNAEHTLEKNEFECPVCKGTDIRVIDGEEMMLMRLEMDSN